VKLLSESSIGAGVRRVEALVGADAYKFLAREHVLLSSLTEIIKGARVEELPERISDLVNKLKEIEKELASVRTDAALAKSAELIKSVKKIGSVSLISSQLTDGITSENLRTIALDLRSKTPSSVVVLVSVVDSKPVLVVATSDEARAAGVKAGALVKIGSTILGGGGGGKDEFAQGGGTDTSKISEALLAIEQVITGK
jgi:alanyl-tRNA synthetase